MKFLEKITPGFLKSIDRYLLLNAPVIWRTRIHYLLFSFVFGNAAIFALTYAFPINKQNVPTIDGIEVVGLMSLAFLSFLALYWAFTQYKYRLRAGGSSSKLFTYGLYFFGTMILASHFFLLNGLVVYRTANVVETAVFNDEFKIIDEKKMEFYEEYETSSPIKMDSDEDAGLDKSLSKEERNIVGSYGLSQNEMDKWVENEGHFDKLNDAHHSINTAKLFINDCFNNYFFLRIYRDFLSLGSFAFLLFPVILMLLTYLKFIDLFKIAFIHFVICCGAILNYELFTKTEPDSLYAFLCVFLGIGAIFLKKNNKYSRMNLFLLFSALPFTAWLHMMDMTSGFSQNKIYLVDNALFYVFIAVVLTFGSLVLLDKRINQPER